MRWAELIGLALFGSAYCAYRARFSHLPLHMDTGFYVTNEAIAARRYRPFRGWNAYFSGNSRLLPEWLHSALYLRVGADRYPRAFRALYAALALLGAVGQGFTAEALLGTHAAFWPALVVSAALLAEAQYGAYFESAEAFEIALQGLGLAALCRGLAQDAAWLGTLGLALLWIDAVLVKSSALLPCALASLAVLAQAPTLRASSVTLGLGAACALLLLLRAAPPSLHDKLQHMQRHERYVRRNYRNPLRLLAVKLGFSAKLALQAPLLPALAALGLLQLPLTAASGWVFGAFALGTLLALLWQGNRVWYYMLPLVSLLGPPSAAAVLWLERVSSTAGALACALPAVLVSVLLNLRKLRGDEPREHGRRVFSVYDRRGAPFGRQFADMNHELMLACQQLRSRVRGESLLVIGGQNQAYVQLEAAFDTPLVSLCELSQAVAGELSPFLPGVPEQRAPRFLLDTTGSLPDARFGLDWLSSYRQVDSFGRIRLFERA